MHLYETHLTVFYTFLMETPLSFRCNSARLYHCPADWAWTVSGFTDYDLWLVCSGRGTLVSNEDVFPLSRGVCFLIPPRRSLCAWTESRHPLRVAAAHFDTSSACRGKRGCFEAATFHTQVRDAAVMEALLKRVAAARAAHEEDRAALWMKAAVSEYIESLEAAKRKTRVPVRHGESIERICKRIRQWPQYHYSVSKLANTLAVCPEHFTRIFRRCAGMSPREFVIRSRLDLAKSLLADTDAPVSRVAQASGYSSVGYFSRNFKQRTGITPTQFRNNAR